MGMYKIEIVAEGAHGCQREIEDGGEIVGCGAEACPDCMTRRFLESLQRQHNAVELATFTHWPGQENEVKDDLLTRKRKGSF